MEVYTKCDELDNIPKPNKNNWIFEIKLICKLIPRNSKVLQVGCMDGARSIAILKIRPDLKITGLDIEPDMIKRSRLNTKRAGFKVNFICQDITKPVPLSGFDYVICLNNTLGYIPEEKKAIANMKKLGKIMILSVYGEKFDNNLATKYFKSINLQLKNIVGNIFYTEEFVNVKRYTKNEVKNWGGKIYKTPLGYFCVILS